MSEALLGIVIEKATRLIDNEIRNHSRWRERPKQLRDTLRLIRGVLEDAEMRQVRMEAVKLWLQKLRDAAHVLDDILEECSTDSFKRDCIFRRRVGRKLDEISNKLEGISADGLGYGLISKIKDAAVMEACGSEVAEWRQTMSATASPQVFGRDEDKARVVRFLLSPDRRSSHSPSIYPIVGSGGLGKTTLIQLVFNDPAVRSHFHSKIWVCFPEVSTNKLEILRCIIESLQHRKCNLSTWDRMTTHTQNLLANDKYLLVLDDVWLRNRVMNFGLSQDTWSELIYVLSSGSNGSCILVSTRDRGVATIMGVAEDQAHHLSHLNENDSWSLFKQRAFGTDDIRGQDPELVSIGKKIVSKCGGSPLAIQALGGLLRVRVRGKQQWLHVLNSELWALGDDYRILPALRLSYFHLTPTAKQCFAFCAVFPKEREILKEDLIHLWMANGFISSTGSEWDNVEEEEVGNMVWHELHQKSFFQDRRIDDSGNIHFKMHVLLHDLARSLAKDECICLEDQEQVQDKLSRNTHHIGFSKNRSREQLFNKEDYCENVESLRTLYRMDFLGTKASIWYRASLRVLSTNSLSSWSLGNLILLRYLEIYDLGIKTLPDSIYNLHKLEILKLVNLPSLHSLPKHLTRLDNLRHLVTVDCPNLAYMFPNISTLSHLRTLSVYIVKKKKGRTLAELGNLKLGGELSIEGLGNVELSEAEKANLEGKEDLGKISLSWINKSEKTRSAADPRRLLEKLQPHRNLKALVIRWYEGSEWPSWMGNNSSSATLNNLVSLQLYNCNTCRKLPQLGKLPSLKTLGLYGLLYVQYVGDGDRYYYSDGVEMRTFPSLEKLTLEALPELKGLSLLEIIDPTDMFPRLSYLRVASCPKFLLPILPHRIRVSRE